MHRQRSHSAGNGGARTDDNLGIVCSNSDLRSLLRRPSAVGNNNFYGNNEGSNSRGSSTSSSLLQIPIPRLDVFSRPRHDLFDVASHRRFSDNGVYAADIKIRPKCDAVHKAEEVEDVAMSSSAPVYWEKRMRIDAVKFGAVIENFLKEDSAVKRRTNEDLQQRRSASVSVNKTASLLEIPPESSTRSKSVDVTAATSKKHRTYVFVDEAQMRPRRFAAWTRTAALS